MLCRSGNMRQTLGNYLSCAGNYPDRVRQLADLLTRHLKAVDAQMPTDKRTGRPVEWPGEAAAHREKSSRPALPLN
jgi:hypothetical protein